MTSLRVKIAVLLVVVIVSVVALLAALFFTLFPPPRIDREMTGLAQHVRMASQLAELGIEDYPLAAQPSARPVDRRMTKRLRRALAENAPGVDAQKVTVSRPKRGEGRVISVPIPGRGWMLFPLSGPGPRAPPWMIFLIWLVLLTLAVTAIAIVVAHRMVQPLVLLETAVESVGPDATLPRLPETGPAEARAAAKALNSLSARLQAAMESRMRLVAAAGHDLRTPITRMRLRAEFVDDPEDRALWLRDIDEMQHIADSAISLVREEVDQATPEPIALDKLIAEIVGELQKQNHAVTLMDTTPAVVRCGPLALSRALRNLIIHAATHGLRARVRVVKGRRGTVEVIISDEGPGIPQHLLSQVFEPFFRADPARSQRIPGAGLGLTIAREIIRRAGGEIEIENRPRGGMLQTVRLPEARA